MNQPQQLRQRLDDIGAPLAATHKTLALIGLGPAGVERDWPAHLGRCLQGYDRVAESAQLKMFLPF